MSDAKLLPCPLCSQALRPFWGRNDERKLNVAGHVHPDDAADIICLLDSFAVYPQNYAAWNRRPSAGAEPEVVEALKNELSDLADKVRSAEMAGHFENWEPAYRRARRVLKKARALLSVPRSVKESGGDVK